MNENKPNTYTQNKKIICNWTDKRKCLIQNRIFKFFVRHGIVVEKVREVISLGRDKWLKNKQVSIK